MVIDVEVHYQWYDHLVLRDNGDAEKVEKAIKEKDFNTFQKFVKKYPPFKYCYDDKEFNVPYFPNMAFLYYQDNIIGEIDIMNPLGFSLITSSEYECG